MALKTRKRINSTLTMENFNFISDLSEKTKINQSKYFDVAIELLKRELKNKSIFDLFEEFNEEKE